MAKQESACFSAEEHLENLLELTAFINEFRSIKRVIWYPGNKERELNGDHSFQLAFLAWFAASEHLPYLDSKAVVFMALIHDLPEVYAGDTPLFNDPTGEIPTGPCRSTKDERERAAIARIEQEWGSRFPDLLEYLNRYQRQACEESQLVYALDKLVSMANVYLDNGRSWKRLRVTFAELHKAKYDPIATHPHTAKLYDALIKMIRSSKHLFPSNA